MWGLCNVQQIRIWNFCSTPCELLAAHIQGQYPQWFSPTNQFPAEVQASEIVSPFPVSSFPQSKMIHFALILRKMLMHEKVYVCN